MINIQINGQTANVRNLKQIGFKSNFSNDEFSELELNVDTLVVVNETVALIHAWTSQYGYHVGIPCTISEGTFSLDFYVDLTDNLLIQNKQIQCKIKRRKGKDNFYQLSKGLTFENIAKQNIVEFNLIQIPFFVIPENIFEQQLVLGISIFSMVQTFEQGVKDTAFLIAEFIAAVQVGAQIIAAGIKAAAQLAYTIALGIALLKLSQNFFNLIFPKVRYLNACKVNELISKGCQHLGFTLQSNLLASLDKLTILPVPLRKDKKSIFQFLQNDLDQSFTNGYPTAQDTTPTLDSLINAIELTFNARTKVNNGVVQIERRDFYQSTATLNLTPAMNLQESRENEYSLNTDEAFSRYVVQYQVDQSDAFTSDNFEPNDAEYGAKNTNVIAPELNLIKGYEPINIPFSMGTPKTKFTRTETLALEFFTVIDTLVGTNGVQTINDRLNILTISQQFYGNTKMLWVESDGKQASNYLNYISAPRIYQLYHQDKKIENNGFKIFKNVPFIMNLEEFAQLFNTNWVNVSGVRCEVIDVDYISEDSKSIIEYREPYNYANGKIITFVVNE